MVVRTGVGAINGEERVESIPFAVGDVFRESGALHCRMNKTVTNWRSELARSLKVWVRSYWNIARIEQVTRLNIAWSTRGYPKGHTESVIYWLVECYYVCRKGDESPLIEKFPLTRFYDSLVYSGLKPSMRVRPPCPPDIPWPPVAFGGFAGAA